MNYSHIYLKRFIRAFIPYLILLLGISAYLADNQASRNIDRLSNALQSRTEISVDAIKHELASVARDLMLLAEQQELKLVLDELDAESLSNLSQYFLLFSANRGYFDQIRWIDEQGREQLRINRSPERSYVVPNAQLQNKADRYYFHSSLDLSQGQIYLSPLDLNEENGEVERPFKPILRLATPLYNSAGMRRGVLVVNLLAQEEILDRLPSLDINEDILFELIDQNGQWLSSQLDTRAFAFQFGDDQTFGDSFPNAWKSMQTSDRGEITNERGYTFFMSLPATQVVQQAAAVASTNKAAISQPVSAHGDQQWWVVGHIPTATLESIHDQAWSSLRVVIALLVLFGLAASAIYARIKYKHDRILTKNMRLSETNNLFSSIGVGVYGLDLDGRCIFINDSACDILGFKRGTLEGELIEQHLLNVGEGVTKNPDSEKQASVRFEHLDEIIFRRRDGSDLPVLANKTAVTGNGGESIGAVVTFIDISTRKQAEAELNKAMEQLDQERIFMKALLETVPNMIWMKNLEGTFLFCNHPVELLFDLPASEIIGKTGYDFMASDLAKAFEAEDKEILAKGSPVRKEEWNHYASDGRQVLLETFKSPMFDNEGKVIGIFGVGHDITERYKTEEQLQLNALVIEQVQDQIIIFDLDRKIIFANRSALALLECEAEDLFEQPVTFISNQLEEPDKLSKALDLTVATGEWHDEITFASLENGQTINFVRTSLVRDKAGAPIAIVYVGSDITAQKGYQDQLEFNAHHDALTKLPNRVLLSDRLEQAIREADRRKTELALLFIDLDGFKGVNDEHGHKVGDEVLCTVAKRINSVLRDEDTLARVGGDEFVVLLRNINSHEALYQVLDRILEQTARKINFADFTVQISASIGLTFYPQAKSATIDQLLSQADKAMYQAKVAGRNRFTRHEPES